ncbi:glycoside hydrolase family 9 protein [candidate division KSB1 bacterium]|nr:glycoside hydrolase family 9 protein [candidate division KSB1 bacterium]
MLKRTYFSFFLMTLLFCAVFAIGADVVHIGTADYNAIVLVIETADGENTPTQDASSWKVNDSNPVLVGRYTYVWYEEKAAGARYPVTLRHHMYIKLSDPLMDDSTYTIETPFGIQVLNFSETETRCEAIHVNQVGYFGGSSIRYANMGIFLGDMGTRAIDPLPQCRVLSQADGSEVMAGTLSYWGDDTDPEMESGEHVYRIDLLDLPDGGPYIISVDGYGCSYPFGVGPDYINQSAYVHFRGLYHQRCGIALEEPYTSFTRGTCHTSVEVTDAEPPDFITERGTAMEIHGGYHDAGDFDRRLSHVMIPAWMLNLYEAYPDQFTDNQYNIPESSNGIPDWLDEALWGLLVWEYLQDESGGVRAGTEANRHPGYGDVNAETDDLIYRTYKIYGHNTAFCAGLFAHASRLVEPYDTTRAAELLERSQRAWAYLQIHDMPTAHDAQMMYASLQLYLATENEVYHTAFQQHATYCLTSGWPEQYHPIYFNLNTVRDGMIFTPYFFPYLITDLSTDQTLVDEYTQLLSSKANEMLTLVNEQPYPLGDARGNLAWGNATNQGRYADPMILTYRLTEDDRYLSAVSQLADYTLGLNPLGKVYVTGLGSNPPNCPLQLDSYFTHQEGKGNVPGIVVFGPVSSPSNANWEKAVWSHVYPNYESLPMQRRYTDGWSFVGANEFTPQSTMVLNICMYGFLSSIGGGGVIADPPAVPDELTLGALSSHQISVSWSDNSDDEHGFKIERKTGENGVYSQIASVNTDTTSITDNGLLPSTPYYYRVRAYNSGGNSEYSAESSINTLGGPLSPSELSVTPSSSSQMDLSWTDNATDEDGFKIERKTINASDWSEIAEVGVDETIYSDTDLSMGMTYYYRVYAFNIDGISDYSNEAYGTLSGGNIALNRPVYVSSIESSDIDSSHAVDGDMSTRWASDRSDPQWIYVDLGAIYPIYQVILHWEAAYGSEYEIQVSDDAVDWTTLYTETEGNGGTDEVSGLSGNGRYVRMYGTARGTNWGYSLWEFEVYSDATSQVSSDVTNLPGSFILENNYPNPFNPQTHIRYSISENAWVELDIFNIRGEKIKSLVKAHQSTGYYTVMWDALNNSGDQISSGVYFYKIRVIGQSKNFTEVRKLLFTK